MTSYSGKPFHQICFKIIFISNYLDFYYYYILGKGRGKQVIAVARTSDLVIMMLDATKPEIHR